MYLHKQKAGFLMRLLVSGEYIKPLMRFSGVDERIACCTVEGKYTEKLPLLECYEMMSLLAV